MLNLTEVQALFDGIDWDDAFVKYVRFESPTSLYGHMIDAPDRTGDLEIALEILYPEHRLLLLRCLRVYEFSVSPCLDLEPRIESSGGRVRLCLVEGGGMTVEAEEVEVYAPREAPSESGDSR